MKKLAVLYMLTLLSIFSRAQNAADLQKAEAILRQMTLDEKIGQMTQVTLGVVSTSRDGILDPKALTNAVINYKVGSILNATNHALTVDQWHTVIRQIQD